MEKSFLLSRRFLAVAALSAFSVAMLSARVAVFRSTHWGFLMWNLILAWLPYFAALVAERSSRVHVFLAVPFLAGWLLFLPNAPYILTDIMHLRWHRHGPIWYDALLITSCAMAGLIAGLESLRIVHRVIARVAGERSAWLVALGCAYLSGFGIYLGRFARLNSWDALLHPRALISQCASYVLDAFAHKHVWSVTLVLGTFFALCYVLYHTLGATTSPQVLRESSAASTQQGHIS